MPTKNRLSSSSSTRNWLFFFLSAVEISPSPSDNRKQPLKGQDLWAQCWAIFQSHFSRFPYKLMVNPIKAAFYIALARERLGCDFPPRFVYDSWNESLNRIFFKENWILWITIVHMWRWRNWIKYLPCKMKSSCHVTNKCLVY